MVDEFSSDLEQEEALRNWWKENWRWVSTGIVLGLAVLFGWKYWESQKQMRADSAAQAFSDLGLAVGRGDNEKVEQLVKTLDAEHADSPYADQAHLALAQTYVAAGKFEQAGGELKLVADKSKDKALAQVAQLRLARVQQQLGHHDEALALLDVGKAGAFAAQVQEARGDVLLAKGDRSGARLAYQAAMGEVVGIEADPSQTELLRLKLQDLGDAETQAAAPEAATPVATTK
jgi:predicted negative regulator of RcsB-dependent stress response